MKRGLQLALALSTACLALSVHSHVANAGAGGGGGKAAAPAAPTTPSALAKCSFSSVQPAAGLLAGADREAVMWITSSDDAGTTTCSQKLVGKSITLKVGNNSLQAHVAAPTQNCGCTAVVHIDEEIPATAVDSSAWQITDGTGNDLGTLTFGIVKVSVTKLVVAVNEKDRTANKQIERLPAKDGSLVAAARDFTKGHKNPFVDNVAVLDTPTSLVGPNAAYEWRLVHAGWDTSVWFRCGDDHGPTIKPADRERGEGSDQVKSAGIWSAASEHCTLHADRIVFAATRTFGTPLVVDLELHSNPASGAPDTKFARIHVQVATSAAAASIPIPLSQVVHLSCLIDRLFFADPSKNAWAGQTIAIDKDAINERKCTFTVDYRYAQLHSDDAKAPAITEQDWSYLRSRGDLQAISVTVTRGTATASADYVIDPNSDKPVFGLALPVPVKPAGTASDDGDYIVNIKLKSTQGVSYLETTFDPSVTTDSNTNVSFTLHPRGFGSITYPVRIGVTFPVTPFSLRFPPRSDEVTSSTSSTRVKVETQRISAMVFVDYWDYEHERNKFPLPFQIQAGLSAVRVGDSTTHLTALAGLALTLPIVGSGASTTSLALGAFREWGLQEKNEDGWVITFSVDLFQPAKTSGTN